MVLNVDALFFIVFLLLYLQTFQHYGSCFQDQTSSRPNTLSDDADDIQRQLDNEARDRILCGRPKAIWVIHFPNPFNRLDELTPHLEGYISPKHRHKGQRRQTTTSNISKHLKKKEERNKSVFPIANWRYSDQKKWYRKYPMCAGFSQSPVDLPVVGYSGEWPVEMRYFKHDLEPKSITFESDGERAIMKGSWEGELPSIHEGSMSRMYWFHSLVLHWPSEHRVAGHQFPIETQAMYISTDYNDLISAQFAGKDDPNAILGIASFYKKSSATDPGLQTMLRAVTVDQKNKTSLRQPLKYFVPPLLSYARYQGSLTVPPCSENVLWLLRAELLTVSNENIQLADAIFGPRGDPIKSGNRDPQELYGRHVSMFKNEFEG